MGLPPWEEGTSICAIVTGVQEEGWEDFRFGTRMLRVLQRDGVYLLCEVRSKVSH